MRKKAKEVFSFGPQKSKTPEEHVMQRKLATLGSEVRELSQLWESRRMRSELPDEHIKYTCKCGEQIARTIDVDGRRCFRIRLVGCKSNSRKDDSFRRNTGGKCRKCQIGHGFCYEDVVKALGFPSEYDFLADHGLIHIVEAFTLGQQWDGAAEAELYARYIIRTESDEN